MERHDTLVKVLKLIMAGDELDDFFKQGVDDFVALLADADTDSHQHRNDNGGCRGRGLCRARKHSMMRVFARTAADSGDGFFLL